MRLWHRCYWSTSWWQQFHCRAQLAGRPLDLFCEWRKTVKLLGGKMWCWEGRFSYDCPKEVLVQFRHLESMKTLKLYNPSGLDGWRREYGEMDCLSIIKVHQPSGLVSSGVGALFQVQSGCSCMYLDYKMFLSMVSKGSRRESPVPACFTCAFARRRYDSGTSLSFLEYRFSV